MKPRISEGMQRQAETKCLQEELVATIHGAFEVAVEVAVQEVSKLVLQITEGMCEEMRRENQTLRQRLQEAEALLDSNQLLRAPKDQPTCSKYSLKNPDAAASCGVRGGDRAGRQDPDPPKHEPMSRTDQRAGAGVRVQDVSAAEKVNGCADVCEAAEIREEVSRLCAARLDSFNSTPHDLEDQDHSSAPLHRAGVKSTLEQVRVKQEAPEEETDGSDCFLDSFKVEDFSSECMSEVQSKMLEEWKPEVLDNQSLEPDSGPAQAASNLTSHLPPPSEPPSLSSEVPNILQLVEPAPALEPPSQVYGVRVRTHRNPANLYACKSCGQMFHLPSLLRRHYGQCPLRQQQQCFQQPVPGGKRTRLQLYPPGCSPFRCTVCNREFNRMENLKTHLRIHTGERPYTCSVCAKCFRHSGALTRHFRIHTGEKPYVCGQCGKSFRNPGGLKFHQRSHTK